MFEQHPLQLKWLLSFTKPEVLKFSPSFLAYVIWSKTNDRFPMYFWSFWKTKQRSWEKFVCLWFLRKALIYLKQVCETFQKQMPPEWRLCWKTKQCKKLLLLLIQLAQLEKVFGFAPILFVERHWKFLKTNCHLCSSEWMNLMKEQTCWKLSFFVPF